MNHEDALRKVVGLIKLSASDTPEAASAGQMAIQLRLKYGISDADLEAEKEDESEFEFFGVRFGFYGKRIAPKVGSVRSLVQEALRLIGDGHLDEIVHLHKDMEAIIELIMEKRNEVVRLAYDREMAEYEKRWDDARQDPHYHTMVVNRIKGDLRKDTVERIVGVSEKSLWKKMKEADEKDRN